MANTNTNLNATPTANRFTIGLFGRRNTGKSSLINALTGQPVAVTSAVAGTTTDPVYKAMELLPIGPVVFIDTAGLDDTGDALGQLRVEKTRAIMRKCHLALIVAEAASGLGAFETELIAQLQERQIPCIGVLSKCDQGMPNAQERALIQQRLNNIPLVYTSTTRGTGIDTLKQQIIASTASLTAADQQEAPLIADLIQAGDLIVLVTPIDASAPKGRLILPQQQTIREIIDSHAIAVVAHPQALPQTLANLRTPPALVITDSQAFRSVAADTPEAIPLTSFSILYARQKGDLVEMVRGVKRIERLAPDAKVLIAEGCTHHRQSDDIGSIKIPRWIRGIAGDGIQFAWSAGIGYPENLADYDLIVHCGGCMLNCREMQDRIAHARAAGVSITNYGVLIAYVMGILPRALQPFPEACRALESGVAQPD